jgi:hypothetical protein
MDATIYIQAFIMNAFGALDNLAWIWVTEKPLNVGKMETGLGPKCKSVRASFTPETQAYLSELDDWFVHIVDFRDALSHRIALYIPLISCLTKMMPRTGSSKSASFRLRIWTSTTV